MTKRHWNDGTEMGMTTGPRFARRILLAALASALLSGPADAQGDGTGAGPGAQQSPRYMSLKSDKVSLRESPKNTSATTWMFRRAGLPVQIIGEADDWRQVRDAEGATGWVLQSMLSWRRTGLVLGHEGAALRADNRENSSLVATIEAGVIANIRSCDGKWCVVAIGDYRGYIDQKRLWGVTAGEIVRDLR